MARLSNRTTDFDSEARATGRAAPPADNSAAVNLAAMETRLFGRNVVRVDGKIERGHGSFFQRLSAEDQAAYVALEALVAAEAKLSEANGRLAAAQAEVATAEENCKTVANNAAAAKDEAARALAEVPQPLPPLIPPNETPAQRDTRLAAEEAATAQGKRDRLAAAAVAERAAEEQAAKDKAARDKAEAERVRLAAAPASRPETDPITGAPLNETAAQRDTRSASERKRVADAAEAERQRLAAERRG